MKKMIPVAILGATGTVGQKLILLLENHPWFEVKELVASERSAGKTYGEATRWKQNSPVPDHLAGQRVIVSGEKLNSRILFSGMDSSVAGPLESRYAGEGHIVVSNARNHRMDKDVPLSIPEVNPEHFELLKRQKYKGGIITNANCVAIPMAIVLCPLEREFGIEWVQVTTMQAISGAGYPGVASMDIQANVVPFISGEESKVEEECQKILGRLTGEGVEPAPFVVSAQCNRVPVFDGHTEVLSIRFRREVKADEVRELLAGWQPKCPVSHLPSAPERPVVVFDENDRPQPRLDIHRDGGMSVCVGRIRPCPIGHVKMVVMGHNTIRGAAGTTILNAEALVDFKYI